MGPGVTAQHPTARAWLGPRQNVPHPVTGLPCRVPERGWGFATSKAMQDQIRLGLVEFREDHTEPPFRKAHLRPIARGVGRKRTDAIVNENDTEGDVEVGMAGDAQCHLQAIPGSGQFFGQPGRRGRYSTIPKITKCWRASFVTSPSCDSGDIDIGQFCRKRHDSSAVLVPNAEDGGTGRFILVEQEDYVDNVTAARGAASDSRCAESEG